MNIEDFYIRVYQSDDYNSIDDLWNKTELGGKHRGDNKSVIENIKYLGTQNKIYEIRTVIVPGLIDNYRTISDTSKLIASMGSWVLAKSVKGLSVFSLIFPARILPPVV